MLTVRVVVVVGPAAPQAFRAPACRLSALECAANTVSYALGTLDPPSSSPLCCLAACFRPPTRAAREGSERKRTADPALWLQDTHYVQPAPRWASASKSLRCKLFGRLLGRGGQLRDRAATCAGAGKQAIETVPKHLFFLDFR